MIEQNWQPIETAPEDGTEIIGWALAWRRPSYILHISKTDYTVGGWWDAERVRRLADDNQPTHWLPAYAPPASECYAPPYEGNEDMWESRPREGGVEPEEAKIKREIAMGFRPRPTP